MSATKPESDAELEGLLERLAALAENPQSARVEPDSPGTSNAPATRVLMREDELPGEEESLSAAAAEKSFFPAAPGSLDDCHIAVSEIEGIILRLLLYQGTSPGVEIARQIGLPFSLTEKVLHTLKTERLLIFKKNATLSDYVYEITDQGLQRARESAQHCSYCGTAPVSLEDYSSSVAAQSLGRSKPRIESLRRALSDLCISGEMFSRLSRAIAAGRGLFLHGAPGNGKTSIAERITAAYGTCIWIPRAISVWGEIIRVFDPSCHEEVPLPMGEQIMVEEKLDHRWVRIRRPTIVVGGELSMESLEVTVHKDTGIGEAPIQMKSNCGTLVIDDFGRQRVTPKRLLNRWIVPLEQRHDYLGLPSGRKICVPFDQFIVFSTNLEPRELVDEAFLRRIPYKIEVTDPSIEQFRTIFEQVCAKQGIAFEEDSLNYLISRHYDATKRPMRFCHPRDILHQVGIFCRFRGIPPVMSTAAMDAAASDYFSVVGR